MWLELFTIGQLSARYSVLFMPLFNSKMSSTYSLKTNKCKNKGVQEISNEHSLKFMTMKYSFLEIKGKENAFKCGNVNSKVLAGFNNLAV